MLAQDVREQLETALQDVRDALQADHADLEILGVDGATARLRLVFGDETCQECILSKDYLQELMLVSLRETMPQITSVRLIDPRALE